MIFCGIDIGTTNTKAVLIDSNGVLIDRANIAAEPPQVGTETVGWYEHFCGIFDHFSSKGHFADSKVICSITAQGGSFILLDEQFNPVSRAYSWTEYANENTVKDMINELGNEQYYHTTGWEPSSWLMACKLKDMVSKKQIPENTKYVATVPDFIHSQITGEFITDITSAQITGLCDFQKASWDEKTLNWVGIDNSFLSKIVDTSFVLFDDIQTKWGKISFATSSHDQYAAMQAAGLAKDKEAMIGSGTAWVINARTNKPVFDNCNFTAHPGRDFFGGCFGNIIVTGSAMKPIGRGLDELLSKFNLKAKQLGAMEKKFNRNDFPKDALSADNLKETGPARAVKRYMEVTGSLVAFLLEKFQPEKGGKIIMSGGAAMSCFWPQVIADLCELAVEAINFSEFTAYGAALHAKSAFEGKRCGSSLLDIAKAKHYEPVCTNQYQQWYAQYQKPAFEKLFTKNRK